MASSKSDKRFRGGTAGGALLRLSSDGFHCAPGEGNFAQGQLSAFRFEIAGWRRLTGQERKGGEFADEFGGFHADGDHLADEANDVFGIVLAVGIVDDAGTLVSGDAVLIDGPFKGAAVAQPVFVNLRRNPAEGQKAVVLKLGFVFGEAHLFDAPVELAGFLSQMCAYMHIVVDYWIFLRYHLLVVADTVRVQVLMSKEEAERFEVYCRERGFKKSTLIARLIRDHLNAEQFRPQRELFKASQEAQRPQ